MEIPLIKINKWLFCFLVGFSSLGADIHEGVELFRGLGKNDLDTLPQFLPYNPVIVEAGALYGNETLNAAKIWPKARIYAFEPNPHAFFKLKRNIKASKLQNIEAYNMALTSHSGTTPFYICYGMNGDNAAFEYASSMLPLYPDMQVYCKGVQIEVPCVTLDDWCEQEGIDHIDLLRLDMEGSEFAVLKSSPQMLKDVKVIYVKTITHPHRVGMADYQELKAFLKKQNFVLLSHWYQPEISGSAIFLSREIFDAYFKMSLGMYQEM